jgi:hypothetical protein
MLSPHTTHRSALQRPLGIARQKGKIIDIVIFQGVPWFTVETRMYVPAQKYSKGHYRVKLLEPIALADEYLMEDGKLSFDALEKVQEKRRFKISVSPAT